MVKKVRGKLVVAAAAMAVVGIAGGAFAVAQDGGSPGDSAPGRTNEGAAPAAINSALVPEAKFVPLAPCRVLDTRSGVAPNTGKIAPNTVKGFDAFGADLSHQGGSGTGCGIPTNADAVQLNLTAVDPAGTGFLRGAAQNTYLFLNPDPGTSQTLPNATLLNYSTALNASNMVTMPVCGGNGVFTGFLLLSSCSGGKEFRVGTFTKASHVVADVVGYYAVPPFMVANGAASPTVVRSNDMGGITRLSAGLYDVATSRDLRGCAFTGTIGNSDDADAPVSNLAIQIDEVSSTKINVEITDADAGTFVDDDFTIVATC